MSETLQAKPSELLRSEGAGKIRGVIHCFTGDYDALGTISIWDFIFPSPASSHSKMPNR